MRERALVDDANAPAVLVEPDRPLVALSGPHRRSERRPAQRRASRGAMRATVCAARVETRFTIQTGITWL